MEAPERIWAWEIDNDAPPPNGYYATAEVDEAVMFVRADLAQAPAPVRVENDSQRDSKVVE